jgi:hypothetical protein
MAMKEEVMDAAPPEGNNGESRLAEKANESA